MHLTIRHDAMLVAVSNQLPEMYKFAHSAYGSTSLLKFDKEIIYSAEGVQQGDPFGPLLFCLTIHLILEQQLENCIFG